MRLLRQPALLLAPLLLLLSACGPRETSVERGNREQILYRSIAGDVSTFDPHLAVNIAEVDVATALFEGLVTEDPVDLHPVPGVAESWELSPDALTYTFHLRPNARWSDGSRVTAADFVASWRRMLTPSLAADNASLLYVLQGAEAFNKGVTTDFSTVGVAAADVHTLRVTLDHPTAYFLSLLTHPAWLPVKLDAIARYGSPYDRSTAWTRPGRLVGNGAFVLKSWHASQLIALDKSDTYWDRANVRLHGVRILPVDNRDTEERMFRTGQLHVTYALPFSKIDTYRRDSPQFLRSDPYIDTYFLRLNTRTPALGDERVRRALSLAIDRTAIAEKILRGSQQPATALTPPGLPSYTPPAALPATPAADEARQLLAAAGYPGGKGFPSLEFLYPTSDSLRPIAEALQEMWRRELGLNVALVNQEKKVVQSERNAGQYQILFWDWVGDYLDPLTFLDIMRSDSGNNYTGWSDARYDSLLFAAARNPDPAARAAQLRDAESLMLSAAPVVPLYYNTHIFLLQPSVHGWHPTLLDHHPYKYVWLEK
ncbi:MAG TPA: peptide ABC transporter substrate-binding protein [Opitutus sp.]|nr:peptide ABC transporter substrate-binding protein [Opitutus sp.]